MDCQESLDVTRGKRFHGGYHGGMDGNSGAAATLADIARIAGVGLATASRALNDAPGVAASTRARVLAVAEEQRFVISPAASGLVRGTTGRVGILVPHLSRWHFGALVEGLDTVLRRADLDVLLYHVGDLEDRARFFRTLPPRRKVDALAVIGFPVADDERQQLELMGVGIVTAAVQDAAAPVVRIDDYRAARRAVDHLINLGHRRIAMIEALDPDLPHLVPQRSIAYHDALEAAGIPADPDLIVSATWGPEEGAAGMGTLLGMATPPSAVYAHSDEVALGAMRTIRRAGLRVPHDVSVIGIDDHPLAALSDLTTVHQDPYEIGRRTAESLLAVIRGTAVDPVTVVSTSLVIRGTTSPPAPAS